MGIFELIHFYKNSQYIRSEITKSANIILTDRLEILI